MAPALAPCDLAFDDQGRPWSPRFRDRYAARDGAREQARHVFIAGNGLPGRWAGRRVFHIVEAGFGVGHTFLETWRTWRADPSRCGRLTVLSIEAHPPDAAQLRAVHGTGDAEADALIAAWPTAVPGLHRRAFDDGCVELLLAFGDIADWARERVGLADAFYLDGFAPDRNPAMWDPRMLQALTRRCRPDATAATWSVARVVRDGLSAAGFVVESRPGLGGRRAMTVARRRPTPKPPVVDARRPPLPVAPASDAADVLPAPRPLAGRRIAVIGAGLAGCATAHALVQAGATVHLLDREATPAATTSGNPAGMVHPVFHHPDTPHARLHRAAALDARVAIEAAAAPPGPALPHGPGLLRLAEPGGDAAAQAAVEAAGLPPAFVQWQDTPAAEVTAGVPAARPGWWFPAGGWVAPAALCARWLQVAATSAPGRGQLHWHPRTAIRALRSAEGGRWRVVPADGGPEDALAAPFDAVVLATAGAATRELLAPHADIADWPLEPVRGQLLGLSADLAGLRVPSVAVAGAGYALPAIDGTVWVGATADAGDADGGIRAADREALRSRAVALGVLPADAPLDHPRERAGVRWRTDDRLPVIGPVPAPGTDRGRADQPRFVPRAPGLYVFAALGSRGIAWAHWGAQVLVSGLAGSACPVESSLLDRVDPARFRVRAWRRPR